MVTHDYDQDGFPVSAIGSTIGRADASAHDYSADGLPVSKVVDAAVARAPEYGLSQDQATQAGLLTYAALSLMTPPRERLATPPESIWHALEYCLDANATAVTDDLIALIVGFTRSNKRHVAGSAKQALFKAGKERPP